ncbi:Formiminoglutamase [Indibacter alkaliphilus LW1]|uniref:Formimidoylglutamase n=1 Tax=Indibacter alkaliphilus (strain CCUG 57479 / KCTC 22604 / LW1) TaxID=1189612 RepID=S2DDU9_INDAL|nr:formimidoylglutamase [Indibacter alkaliphilus]EOZ97059.1 Formiminoglutamase [Indibacter alkaliphilus LW1]
MAKHIPANQKIWTGRNSQSIDYWHQAMSFVKVTGKKKVALLGYCGDEGVRRNQGRIGAAEGPDSIRKMLAGMAYHLSDSLQILDLGNILTVGNDMEGSHQLLTEKVTELLQENIFPVLIGGGHDLALAHGRAILKHLEQKNESLGIINLDAHFDLRDLNGGKGHSGSPFYQLSQESPDQFQYLCLGIQKPANPASLFKTAKSTKTQWMDMEEFRIDNWDYIAETLQHFYQKVNKIYLSIDLDGFSTAFAPGVSAPSPLGFSPELAFKVMEWLAISGKMISMDVVELNPKYDQDNATARLAARCIEFMLRKLFIRMEKP